MRSSDHHAAPGGASGATLAAVLIATMGLLGGCADRPLRNPLDPRAEAPLDLADPLRALAGDGHIELRWDFRRFADVHAVRIYRDGGEAGPRIYERPVADTSFVDTAVANDVLYEYRLALDVAGEDEVPIAGQRSATPGPEHGWIADQGSGLVWRLTPDGRQGLFARGRFPSLTSIAVDRVERACWVADEDVPALHRISAAGELTRHAMAPAGARELVIDGGARRGWLVPVDGSSVQRFELEAAADSLPLISVDGVFTEAAGLASAAGGVWIADRGADRVVRFAADGERVGEWQGLIGLVDIAAEAGTCCAAWALVGDGARLVGLGDADGREVALPLGPARALDVAEGSGEVWVLGDGHIAAFDADGGPLLQIIDVAAGTSLAIDGTNRQLWSAASTQLSKLTLGGLTYRTQLTGFTSVIQVVVDPGR